MELHPGQHVGDYEVLEALGAGGMATVYKVRNTISGRLEAMKVLQPDLAADDEAGERFLREIRVLAALEHPHIARLHTAFRHAGHIVMVMECVDGTSLDRVMQRGRIPLDHIRRIVGEVLDALAYAHAQGVVHRDVKPANILLDPQYSVRLADFGIARLQSQSGLTDPGRTLGSLYYMAPEQIRGDADIDGRADIYSLGIMLYEMATGRRPFQGDSQYSIMSAHLNDEPAPPNTVDPAIPDNVNAIILMAISKAREKRFHTAEAMARALGGPAERLSPAAPMPAPVQRATPRSHRKFYILAGASATLAAILIFAALPLWEGPKAEPAPPPPSPAPEAAPPDLTPPPSQPPPAQLPPAVPLAKPRTPAAAKAVPLALQPRVKPAVAPPPATQQAAQPEAQPPAAAPQPAPPAPVPDLEPLRERLNQLGLRTAGVRRTLDRLKQQQARMGLGTRADFLSAESRLINALDDAEAALKGQNPAAARKHLDAAEPSLRFLEDRLGQ